MGKLVGTHGLVLVPVDVLLVLQVIVDPLCPHFLLVLLLLILLVRVLLLLLLLLVHVL